MPRHSNDFNELRVLLADGEVISVFVPVGGDPFEQGLFQLVEQGYDVEDCEAIVVSGDPGHWYNRTWFLVDNPTQNDQVDGDKTGARLTELGRKASSLVEMIAPVDQVDEIAGDFERYVKRVSESDHVTWFKALLIVGRCGLFMWAASRAKLVDLVPSRRTTRP